MASGSGFGEWEKYTKGIGSKLLAKMGFEPGKGLGKNQQGISAPIEVNKRPGLGAIGSYDFEEKAAKKGQREKEKGEIQKKKDIIKDDNQSTTYKRDKVKKIKVYEKSIDEIILEGIQTGPQSISRDGGFKSMKILDMTGPDQRVLSGISQLHQSKAMKPKDDYTPTEYNTRFDVPELKANLDRLLRMTENKLTKCIEDNERDLKNFEVYTDEIKRLEAVIQFDEIKLQKFDEYDKFVKELEDLDKDESIEAILERFEHFHDDKIKSMSKLLRFDDLLVIALKKRLQKELRFWKPFTKDDRVLNIFKRIQKLVIDSKTYDILLWNSWNTSVFRALQGWHSMKNYNEPIEFFEQWEPILPAWLFEYEIKQLVVTRLVRELEEWNPLEDTIPVTGWIFPWYSVILENNRETNLEELFEPVYCTVRQKLGQALFYWQPQLDDRSVFSMIHPWKTKFSEASMQSFLNEKISPKLEIILKSIKINASMEALSEDETKDNNLKAWNWVTEWRHVLSKKGLIVLLEKSFFPNWLIAIHDCLSRTTVDYALVEHFYKQWKKRFANIRIVDENRVRKQLYTALTMMHHRLDPQIGLKAYQFYDNTLHKKQEAKEKSTKSTVRYSHLDAINFKQMVERITNDKGILFMPINGRFQEGRQVYQFDSRLVYIDNQVLFHQKIIKGQRLWSPIELQDLIDLCRHT